MNEKLKDQWYELGRVAAQEEFAKIVRAKSGEAFLKDKDDLAHYLKTWSKELACEAEKARTAYDAKYHLIPEAQP